MSFNPNIINTNVPPPNYHNVPFCIPLQSTNPCLMPPIPQQHMFNPGMHVPSTNPPPFNAVLSNNLSSSSVGFVQNPVQTTWNNKNTLNLPVINNQNFTSTPPIPYAQNNQIPGCFQAPPPLQNKQFQDSVWSNSSNHPQNNPNGLISIAPNSTPGNNQQNNNFTQNLYTPVRPDFQSSTAQFDGSRNNGSIWSSNNSSNNEPFRFPPPINHMPVKESHFDVSRDSNVFIREKSWNPIQKTNVPDSNIFQNPGAIFNMTKSNQVLNPPGSNVAKINFQELNVTNRIPMNQGSQKFNSLHSNFIPNNDDSVQTNNKSLKIQNRYFQQTNDLNRKNIKRFHETKIQDYRNNNFKQDTDYRDNNFKLVKLNYSEEQNLPFQHNNQNLIDVCVVSSKDAVKGKSSNPNFLQSNNYCRSNSSSTVIEEFTISDSESIENKSSPQKHPRNKRIFENLQKINAESSINPSHCKMAWMTENIEKSLQKRNMLFKQARTTNDPAVWDEYNKLKNEINEEIRKAKLNAKNIKPKRNTPKVWQDKGKKFPFNCDTCDRGFSSKDELGLHMALHIKCHHWGCNFEAHPKVVSLHQRMQHDTGYADVINKLQNEEEIKKWREERKRRFPTAENILKKKAEQAEKESRGEVIEEKDHGQFKKRRFEDRNKNNSLNRRDRSNRKRRPRNPFQRAPEIDLAQDCDSDAESEYPTKLPKFKGMNEYSLINDDVKTEDLAEVKTEDDDESPLEIPIQKVSLNESSDSADESLTKEGQQELLHETTVEDSSSTRPNTDEKSNNHEKLSLPSKDTKGNKRERNEKRCRPPVPPRPKNSLLKMLLSDEIRHERNVIMQCIRHTVRNKFFRIEA